MIHDWFSAMELPLTWKQFCQLPQNPAYKYEYFHRPGLAFATAQELPRRPRSGELCLPSL